MVAAPAPISAPAPAQAPTPAPAPEPRSERSVGTARTMRPAPRVSAVPDIADDAPTEAVRAGSTAADPAFAVPPEKRVVIGITGEPGAGKSALARQLGALGGAVIDVDKLGHELLESPRMKRDLAHAFGEDILSSEGDINRRALAEKAFSSADNTAKLNRIVHPKLASRTRALVAKNMPFVVIDAGLLHELGLGDLCTTAIYLKAAREARTMPNCCAAKPPSAMSMPGAKPASWRSTTPVTRRCSAATPRPSSPVSSVSIWRSSKSRLPRPCAQPNKTVTPARPLATPKPRPHP
jgi:dephospho-CoA kinase